MIDPHKEKYFPLYWRMVEAAAAESLSERHQVGAIVVTPTGMISVGWNGTPSGLDNCCESREIVMEDGKARYKSKPETIHAERNAIDKMTRQGVPTSGSVLFVSRAPCFECGKALHGLGLKYILYQEDHDDMRGVELLRATGTPTIKAKHFKEAQCLSVV